MTEETDPRPPTGNRGAQSPSTDLAAFVCPHCSAHTQQGWFDVFAQAKNVGAVPQVIAPGRLEEALRAIKDPDKRASVRNFYERRVSDLPALNRIEGKYVSFDLVNMHFAQCFICDGISIWLRDRMVWPDQTFEVRPNEDMPPHILSDFTEAAAIADVSPRGAAALLRLCIERLCLHLGKEGSIDAMIGQMVTDGLNIRVKQALDVVRVTGNAAVHPGTISFGDDPATVTTLFKMVNLIVEKTISEAKHVEEAFASIPPETRAWIDERDKGAVRKRLRSLPAVPDGDVPEVKEGSND